MRTRYRYDKDMDCVVDIRDGSNYYEPPTESGPNVISDDVGAGVKGLRNMASNKYLDSKSAHRKENKARGLEEVGNEQNFASKPETLPKDHYGKAVKQAYEQFDGNYNGIADRVRNERLRRV